MAVGLPLLYVLISILRMPVPAATLLGGELGLLLRYFVNDRWVFHESARSWRRLWQFHVAAAAGFAVWWLVTNILARAGVHYLIAAVCGTAASACCSVVTNFLWVWRSAGASSTDALADDPKHGGS
jgi:dolichol-phosphate mannosyltransferase